MQARVLSRLLIILACIFLAGAASTACQDLEEIAAGIARGFPDRVKEFEDLAREMAHREQKRVEDQAREMVGEQPGPSRDRILVFVSLGEKPSEKLEENKRLLKEIKEISPEAIVVLRGVPQGYRTLGELIRYIRQITDKNSPQVILNPVLFQRYNVTVAPTLVFERDGQAVAWARGIINGQWLKNRVEKEKANGDLGKWGETAAVAERDLIEEMKARLAGVDWEAKKEQAFTRYWQKQRFIELPKAKEERVFYLDATYRVEKDFILPDGKVVARAGEKIDLFKIIPPTFMLMVFDAGDPRQLEWAVKTGKQHSGKYRVKYITTRIADQDHGWESLERLNNTLDAPVFLLTEAVRDRFKLSNVPSTVRFVKAKQKFEVKEEICAEK